MILEMKSMYNPVEPHETHTDSSSEMARILRWIEKHNRYDEPYASPN